MRFDPSYNKFKNCLCANGDTPETTQTDESANKQVLKLSTWQYVRAGLAIVGAVVVIGWIWKKVK